RPLNMGITEREYKETNKKEANDKNRTRWNNGRIIEVGSIIIVRDTDNYKTGAEIKK
ncbi:13576_t:CDS:1, partial [Dentiscutata heterogama]